MMRPWTAREKVSSCGSLTLSILPFSYTLLLQMKEKEAAKKDYDEAVASKRTVILMQHFFIFLLHSPIIADREGGC